jgi:putative flavoprotein involved in K+ transport
MKRVDIVVIGGGQAGLAMGYALAHLGIDHVILERGEVAERWRSERWDSLRLLTPNWMTRLPGWRYQGADPDRFMPARDLAGFLAQYARSFGANVETGATVTSVALDGDGYRVVTGRGTWNARGVVIATGHCDVAIVPQFSGILPRRTMQISAQNYKRPAQLADGSVLVVGGSSSGLQIAEELRRDGREVTLSVGQHTRLPRRYRGRDIMAWLDAIGSFDDPPPPGDAGMHQPSLQLVGSHDDHSLDLARMESVGVRVVGRCVAASSSRLRFDASLARTMAASDAKLQRLLMRIDAFITASDLTAEAAGQEGAPLRLAAPPQAADLAVPANVVWATGYRRDYSWLHVPVLDARGEISHFGGVTPARGLYVLGLRFLRRRSSNFIDGVGRDATDLAATICDNLRMSRPQAA